MRLRSYQERVVRKATAALIEHDNTLIVVPTGGGKTVILSAIASQPEFQGAKGLVLQHREELLDQNRATFSRVNPDITTSEFSARAKSWHGQFVFAMAQTLSGESNLKTAPRFDFIIMDEAHHAVAPSWMRILTHLGSANPSAWRLGVTATANRGDKRSLRPVFSNVAEEVTLPELIKGGYLVKPRAHVLDLGVQDGLSKVRKTALDFDMQAVAEIMNRKVVNDAVVENWKQIAGDRQTVFFCSTVEHAKDVVLTLERAGVAASWVDGSMGKAQRRSILSRYDRMELQCLVNVMVLTEGWDNQPTSCVVLLRPSSFKSTMIQMIGRGLRRVEPERYPGVVKSDCLVLDFGTSLLLHGGIEDDTHLEQGGTKDCPDCGSTVPMQMNPCAVCGYEWPKEERANGEAGGGEDGSDRRADLTEIKLTEIEIFEDSPFRWEEIFDGLVLMACAFDAWTALLKAGDQWIAVGRSDLCEHLSVLAHSDDKHVALSQADDWMRENADSRASSKNKSWLRQPATEAQKRALGVPSGDMSLTKYRASCLFAWRKNERAIRSSVEKIVDARRVAA